MRTLKIIIFAAVVLAILIVNVPIPINQSISGVEIKVDDPEYCIPRTILIEGKYYINILSDNNFIGKISVSEYPKTYDFEKMGTLQFMREQGNHSPLYYSNNNGEDYFFGILYAKPLFRNMVIVIFDQGGFNSNNGRCIVAHAESFEDAFRIFKNKSGFLLDDGEKIPLSP